MRGLREGLSSAIFKDSFEKSSVESERIPEATQLIRYISLSFEKQRLQYKTQSVPAGGNGSGRFFLDRQGNLLPLISLPYFTSPRLCIPAPKESPAPAACGTHQIFLTHGRRFVSILWPRKSITVGLTCVAA